MRVFWVPPSAFPALPLGEAKVPSTFHFPTDVVYADGVVTAMNEFYSGGMDFVTDLVYQPTAISASGIKATIEAAAGFDLNDIVGRGLSSQVTRPVVGALTGLINASLDVAIDTASEAIANVVGNAMQTVPVLGVIVRSLFTSFFSMVSGGHAAGVTQELRACLDQKLRSWCPTLARADQPVITVDGNSATPSDLFRGVAYAYATHGNLPVSPASLYVGMCGQEAEGLWPYWKDAVPTGLPVGIPREVQRKMWKLIRGIMAGVQPVTWDPIPLGSREPDAGRTLMPLLQDIILKEWNKGHINREYLVHLSNQLLSRFKRTCETCKKESSSAAGCTFYANTETCKAYVDIVSPIVGKPGSPAGWLWVWRNKVEAAFREGGIWRSSPKWRLAGFGANGRLTLNAVDALKVEKDVKTAVADEGTWYDTWAEKSGAQKALDVGLGSLAMLSLAHLAWTGTTMIVAKTG